MPVCRLSAGFLSSGSSRKPCCALLTKERLEELEVDTVESDEEEG
jgi:hypothetical protein